MLFVPKANSAPNAGNTDPKVKPGVGSIMLKGMLLLAGTGKLFRIVGKIDDAKFRAVLESSQF